MYDFAPVSTILAGLITGLIFGLLLQKGGVTRYQVILGQFLLKDFTVLKVMLTAIVTGAIGVWGMLQLGMLSPGQLHVKNAELLANGLGGVIFGIGMAVLGYCPGTGMAALGDGSRHAIWGVLGMFVGGWLYAETYPLLQGSVLDVLVEGEITFADVTGVSPWWFIGGMAVVAVIVFLAIEWWEHSHKPPSDSGDHQPPHAPAHPA